MGGLGPDYSIEAWISNGLPADARAITGVIFFRETADPEASPGGPSGDLLFLGGTSLAKGRLVFSSGPSAGRPGALTLEGKTEIPPGVWSHLVLAREGKRVIVYLNGAPEIEGQTGSEAAGAGTIFLGGRAGLETLEGRIDEAAVYGRALGPEEAARHYQASGLARPKN